MKADFSPGSLIQSSPTVAEGTIRMMCNLWAVWWVGEGYASHNPNPCLQKKLWQFCWKEYNFQVDMLRVLHIFLFYELNSVSFVTNLYIFKMIFSSQAKFFMFRLIYKHCLLHIVITKFWCWIAVMQLTHQRMKLLSMNLLETGKLIHKLTMRTQNKRSVKSFNQVKKANFLK